MSKMMKRLMLLSTLLFAFTACDLFTNFETPNSVVLKTEADFKVPLGTLGVGKDLIDLNEVLGPESIQKSMGSSLGSNVAFYNYIPDSTDDTLKYLIHYPLYTVPLDIGSYLDGLDIDGIFNDDSMGFSFNQKLDLPAVAINQTLDLFDVSKIKSTFINQVSASIAGSAFETALIPEPGKNPFTGEVISVTASDYMQGYDTISVEFDFAEGIEYKDGSGFDFKFERTDSNELSSDFSFKISAKIIDMDGNEVPGCKAENVELRDGGVFTIPFKGTIPSKIKVKLNGTLSNGTLDVLGLHSHSYKITPALNPNTDIAKISNITANPSDFGIELPEISQTVSLASAAGYFETAEIGEGSVIVQAVMPAGWSNFVCNTDLTISGAGLGTITVPDGSEPGSYFLNKKLDLKGKTFAPSKEDSDLSVKGSISFEIKNATIDFTKASDQTITANVACSLNKLASATIDFSSDRYASLPLPYSIPTDGSANSIEAPGELLSYVSEIDFPKYRHDADGNPTSEQAGGFGVTCDVVNSFPAGNNIPISIKSNFFSYSKNAEIRGYGSSESNSENWTSYFTAKLPSYDPDVKKYIDFTVSIPDKITLSNIEMNKSYELGVSNVKLVVDWDSIVFNTSAASVEGQQDLSDFDIVGALDDALEGTTFKDLMSNMQLSEIPVYLFAQQPEESPLGTITLDGSVNINYVHKDENQIDKPETIELFPNGISFTDPMEWPAGGTDINSDSPVTKVLEKRKTDKDYIDFSKIVNDKPQGLSIDYNVKLQGNEGAGMKRIYYNQILALAGAGAMNISIDLAMEIPLALNLLKASELSIMSYVNPDWENNPSLDLFNRTGENTLAQYKDYASAIEYFSINLKNQVNNMFDLRDANGNSAFYIVVDDRAASGFYTKVDFVTASESPIKITNDQINQIFNSSVFHPKIAVVLGSDEAVSTFSIGRSFLEKSSEEKADDYLFATDIIVEVKADPDSEILLWKSN